LNHDFARVGMFGGAFDPPHRAHVALAREAIGQLRLDRLFVIPTGQAWHKDRALTAAEHRLAMTRIAFEGIPQVVVDERELKREGATYSVETLRELRDEHPGTQLVLLMGEDQAGSFRRWIAWQEIARIAILGVAGRGSGEGLATLRALPGVRVETLQWTQRTESATEIRARLAAGQDIADLVEPAVASYIESHHLYRPA
jgi:nicotinate-nucleotide adenylyltransferase